MEAYWQKDITAEEDAMDFHRPREAKKSWKRWKPSGYLRGLSQSSKPKQFARVIEWTQEGVPRKSRKTLPGYYPRARKMLSYWDAAQKASAEIVTVGVGCLGTIPLDTVDELRRLIETIWARDKAGGPAEDHTDDEPLEGEGTDPESDSDPNSDSEDDEADAPAGVGEQPPEETPTSLGTTTAGSKKTGHIQKPNLKA